ncbi:hypothetical protein [Nitrosomonas europaea]|uniref:hypothetical protein n=1 Tax=Nitrosomonas europaea TaxID=915 RepID=UPI002C5AF9D5|nr:hypothetical protein [Nitrosomonas europaea]HRN82448.1 hypothetical protein [Nitrosomonas europaea]
MSKECFNRIKEDCTNERKLAKAESSCGPAIVSVHIGKDGNNQILHAGFTAWGKGHAPKGGYKPLTIIEQEGSATQINDNSPGRSVRERFWYALLIATALFVVGCLVGLVLSVDGHFIYENDKAGG